LQSSVAVQYVIIITFVLNLGSEFQRILRLEPTLE